MITKDMAHAGKAEVHRSAFLNIYDWQIKRYVFVITKKGMLMQERQRSAEAHSLKETVRRLRFENKEVYLCDH